VLLGICFLSLGAFVAIHPPLQWLLSAALHELKNPASGEAGLRQTKKAPISGSFKI